MVVRAIQGWVDQAHKIKIEAILAEGFRHFFDFEAIEESWFDFDITLDLLTYSGVENTFDPVLELGSLLVHSPSPNHKYFVDKLISLAIFYRALQRAQKHCVLFLIDFKLLVLLVASVTAEDDVHSARQRLFLEAFPGLSSHNHRVLLLALFVVEGLGDGAEEFEVFGQLSREPV